MPVDRIPLGSLQLPLRAASVALPDQGDEELLFARVAVIPARLGLTHGLTA